jgi:hypothetical protein
MINYAEWNEGILLYKMWFIFLLLSTRMKGLVILQYLYDNMTGL